MAVKQKRIRCTRCGERETVMRGERGPASIYCDLCRDEVKREQNALRAQAYRQRKANYGGGSALNAPPPGRAADFVVVRTEGYTRADGTRRRRQVSRPLLGRVRCP